MSVKFLVSILGVLVVFVVGISILVIGVTPNTSSLNAADLSATALCVEQTAVGGNVMLYKVFGTPTPAPNSTATPTQPMGNPNSGKNIFTEVGKCHVCHSIDSMEEIVGPSLMHIASIASTKLDGVTGEDYIRSAILRPNEVIIPVKKPGIMPTTYSLLLTQEQLNDLVAYLMTLQ